MPSINQAWPYLLGFFLLNLLQSVYSELAHDEAYYWVYSQHLDWGYFDHPPAIAVLIKLGYTFVENELGVRLFVILANLLTIYLLYVITRPTQVGLFFLLLYSCVITHVGFLAVPDIPLILSVALFFYFYEKYVESYDWKNALLLGIVIALMGYSKYHGIVVLICVLLSNLHLLKQKTFYLIIGVATMLYLPHLYWQLQHDFPTFRFHLFDRSSEPYRYSFVLEYILGQLLIFGPLIGILLFGTIWRFVAGNTFERGLQFTCYGIFGFFLLSSFKGRVEPNWTAMGMIPLIYMSYHIIVKNPKLQKWSYRLGWLSLVLIIFFRSLLVFDILPSKHFPLRKEFYGWKEWATSLENVITKRPALFFNSYQRAAKYSFYSNSQGHAINTVGYAGSQYDLLIENQEALQGERVAIIHQLGPDEKGYDLAGIDNVYIQAIDSIYFYNRLRLNLLTPPPIMSAEEKTLITLEICNPTDKTVYLKGNHSSQVKIGYQLFKYKEFIARSEQRTPIKEELLTAGQCIVMKVPLQAPKEPGTYRYRMAINNGIYDERNTNFQTLEVTAPSK